MAFRKRTTFRRRRPVVGRKLQRIRKLAGQKPITWAESLGRAAGPIGKLATSVATIAGLVNSETKYKDTAISSEPAASNNSALVYFNNLAEGDTQSTRNGRSVLDKDIQWRLRVNGSESATYTALGYAVIMDKEPELGVSSTTAWSTVFNSNDPASLINKDNSDRFVILKRGEIMLDNSGQNEKMVHGFIPLKGIHTKYVDASANATGIDLNAIFLTATSDQDTNYPHINGQLRFQYYDN